MKKILAALIIAVAAAASAQVSNPSVIPASPPGSCTTGVPLWAVFSTGNLYICNNGTPSLVGGGGSGAGGGRGGGGVTAVAGGVGSSVRVCPAIQRGWSVCNRGVHAAHTRV